MSDKSYLPPQSPILIQPGDKGFETVGKAYNRMIWTYGDWAKRKKKIVNPNKLWDKYGKKMTKKEMDAVLKNAYLESANPDGINESSENKNYTNNMYQMNEKSVSSAQQRLMGQAWALRTGEIDAEDINPIYRDAIEKIAFGDMTDKELKKFAQTKTKALPHHVRDNGPQPGPAGVEETASPKQIPSNYIGAVPGGSSDLQTTPNFNWDAGKGKSWWENTGKKAPSRMKFIKEFDNFLNTHGVNEMRMSERDKVDALIDHLKEVLDPFSFRVAYDKMLGLVIDLMIPDYETFFNRFKSVLTRDVIEGIPGSLKPSTAK
jgi:hypothetical protein